MYEVLGSLRTRTYRVLWALEEIGAPYEHHAHAPHSAEIRTRVPSGKVPALISEGQVITDSTAILTYLADKHGALTAPAGTISRARQDAVTFATLDELEGPLWSYAKHKFILPEEHRVPELKDSVTFEISRAMRLLSDRLGDSAWAAGDDFSIADIVTGHCLVWATRAKFPIEGVNLERYFDRIRARDAFARTDALTPTAA